ncbi:MAG: pyruvate ferredoxin oxidoreductase [Thermodesulfobacteriota bacterium]
MNMLLTGDHAVAYGVKLVKVEVIAAYPITPQTPIYEKLSDLTISGELNARMIRVESEQSAMAACMGASLAGARVFTATASQGLAMMHELLHFAAGDRLPIVMVNVNRSIAAPWSFWSDQTDSLSQRDTGWVQIYSENNQEALDNLIQAYRVAEEVLLPVMVVIEAFLISHTTEPVEMPDPQQVDRYLPPYSGQYRLDVNDPRTIGSTTTQEQYREFRYKMQRDMETVKGVVEKADREFKEIFNRGYGLVEEYQCHDAQMVLVTSGTIAGTARDVVDELRGKGKSVGLVKIRLFRPFPGERIRQALSGASKIAVLDRNVSLGHGGIFCQEVKAALANVVGHAPVFGFLAGVGGCDVSPALLEEVVEYMEKHTQPKEDYIWVR